MTEEQIAQLLVQIAEEMRKAETATINWDPERGDYETAARRFITITLDMPKAVH